MSIPEKSQYMYLLYGVSVSSVDLMKAIYL